MGMPGVGKGTQAALLRERTGLPHVSTGDILREAVRVRSPVGRRVKGVLESGKLVSDDLMRELIVERLQRPDAQEGFILDGFPRTEKQVEVLDGVLKELDIVLDGVYVLTASEAEIVERLSGRRVCPRCSAVFHLETRLPSAPGVCDDCGSALVQRPDDTEAVIRERLRVFADQTRPALESYARRGLLREIDASGCPESIARELGQAVERA